MVGCVNPHTEILYEVNDQIEVVDYSTADKCKFSIQLR